MKIVVFTDSLFEKSQTFIYNQVLGLSKNHEVTLLCFEKKNLDIFPLSNAVISVGVHASRIDRLRHKVFRKVGISGSMSRGIKKRMLHTLGELKPDIVHIHFGFSAVPVFGILKKLNIPLVVTFHGVDASPQYIRQKQYARQLPALFEYCKSLVIVSEHMTDTLGLDRWLHKTHLVRCGVNVAHFTSDRLRPVANKKLTLLHSGRICAKKGVPDLISAFVELSSRYDYIYLDIIGEGDEKQVCEQLIVSSGMTGRVRLLGSMTASEIKARMERSDIFVLNSRTSDRGDMEGSPVALMEAMSMGMPAVSTYHAGIPRFVTHGYNGLLVRERDTRALADALETLIIDEKLRSDIAANARESIKRYDIKVTNGQLEDVLTGKSEPLSVSANNTYFDRQGASAIGIDNAGIALNGEKNSDRA